MARSLQLLVRTLALLLAAAVSYPARGEEPDATPQVDPQALHDAATAAIRNGIATLMARQSAPGNPTGLVFPPVSREVRLVTVRLAWKDVEVPVFDVKTEERLVPKFDEYGNPQGFVKRQIVVQRVRTGTRTERRLVPDPNGDVERQQKRIVYGEGAQAWVPRGLVGLNGQALYVYARAGLASDRHAAMLAFELEQLVNQIGLPDTTWDLAWLAAGLVAHNNPDRREFTQRVLGRLIDGQIRERGDGQGLWGPVCIHYPMLAKGLEAEVLMANEVAAMRKQVEALPPAQSARGQAALDKLIDQQSALRRIMNDVSWQGRRMADAIRRYEIDDRWAMPGLPYDIYSYIVVDLDSTVAAAFALDQAQAAGVLPAQTVRTPFQRKPLAPPEATQPTIAAAAQAVVRVQKADGGWDPSNLLLPNKTFGAANIGRGDISVNGVMPALLNAQSLRSNLTGAAALVHLARATPARSPLVRSAIDKADPRMIECVTAWLDADPRDTRRRILYRGEVDKHEDLVESKGQLPVAPWQATAATDLPFGHAATPYDLLPLIAGWTRPYDGSDAQKSRLPKLVQRVTHRLVVMQEETGQWADEGRGASMSSGDMADTLRVAAVQRAARSAKSGKNTLDLNRWSILNTGPVAEATSSPKGLYATLSSLMFLLESATEPIDMTDAVILPPAGEGEDDGDLMPDDAVAKASRPNPHLDKLLSP